MLVQKSINGAGKMAQLNEEHLLATPPEDEI